MEIIRGLLLETAGWLMIVIILAIAIAAVIHVCSKSLYRLIEGYLQAKIKLHVQEIGENIIHDANWFVEDVNTMLALKVLGEYIIREGRTDPGKIRDEWRKRRSEA